ncbi:MAG: hypothetical protein WC647_07195 [Desulfomonilaceae bacterium]|jgi:hypothetical protein
MKRVNRRWVEMLGFPDPDECIDKDAVSFIRLLKNEKRFVKRSQIH